MLFDRPVLIDQSVFIDPPVFIDLPVFINRSVFIDRPGFIQVLWSRLDLDYRGLDLDSAFDLRLRTGGLDCGDVCHHRED